MSSRIVSTTFAALVILLSSNAVRAQAAAEPDSLVHEGVGLRRAGRDTDALERFRRAYELGHRLNALGQMGFAEQALGQWVAASQHVREALTHPEDPWVQRNRAALEASRAAIEQHVGTLEVLGEPAGAEVSVNGQIVGSLPLAAPVTVETGDASVVVQLAQHLPSTRTVHVNAGQLSRASVRLERVPVGAAMLQPPPSPPPSHDAARPLRTRTPGWVMPVAIGGGVAAVAVVVVVAVLATSGTAPITPGTWGIAQER